LQNFEKQIVPQKLIEHINDLLSFLVMKLILTKKSYKTYAK